MAVGDHGSIDDQIADQKRREEAFQSAIKSHPELMAELSEHVSDEFALKEYDNNGDEISPNLGPSEILAAQVRSYLTANSRFTSRTFTLAKTSLPRELRITGTGDDPLLQCRMIWMEASVDVTHPAIEEIWDDVAVCLKHATSAVGGKTLLSPGKPSHAWRKFCKAFYPQIVEATGRNAGEFRLRLNIRQDRGSWFAFQE